MHQEDRVVGANYYSAKISLMLGGSIRPGVQRMLAKSWTFSLWRVSHTAARFSASPVHGASRLGFSLTPALRTAIQRL